MSVVQAESGAAKQLSGHAHAGWPSQPAAGPRGVRGVSFQPHGAHRQASGAVFVAVNS